MRDDEIQKKIDAVMDHEIDQMGYAAPVDILMDLGVLDQRNYLSWRKGNVPYLEKVCHMNLSKSSKVMKAIRYYAFEHHLKPSYTVYKRNGKGNVRLRFSHSGNASIEKNYATHYIDSERAHQLNKTNR